MTMRLGLIAGVLALSGGASLAQDQVGPQDLTRTTADPVEKLVGLWQVAKLDPQLSSNAMLGRVLRIDRQSVETLTLGTCTNPRFSEQLGSITVTCLGQDLAKAAWDPQDPGTIEWSERGLSFALHRLSGTEALDSPPAAEDAPPVEEEPAGEEEGTEDAQ